MKFYQLTRTKDIARLASVKVLLALLLACIFSFQKTAAQHITDFKLYISADTTSMIKFHDPVSEWAFDESNGSQVYDISLNDDYSMKIIARQATAEIMHLKIMEGKRQHKFIILYHEGIDTAEMVYDYTNLETLARLIKENKGSKKEDQEIMALLTSADSDFKNGLFATAKEKYDRVIKAEPANTYASKQLEATNKKLAQQNELVQQEQDKALKALTDQAGAALQKKDFETALKLFTQAQQLRPEDGHLKSQIIDIRRRMDEAAQADKSRKNDSLYKTVMAAADIAFNEKRYGDAIDGYRQSLLIKPGDNLAGFMVQKTEKEQADVAVKMEAQQKQLQYENYLQAADKAFRNKEYALAKINYTKVLSEKSSDAYAIKQLEKIAAAMAEEEQQQLAQQKNDALEIEFAVLVKSADSAFYQENWALAKSGYEKAAGLINKPYPKQQLVLINQKLNAITNAATAERQQQQQDSIRNEQYQALVKQGDDHFNNGNFIAAQNAYKKALLLKNEVYPKDQLQAIEARATADLARNKAIKDSLQKEADAIKKYNTLMAKAKVAYINSDYVTAQETYTEAATIRPQEAEPQNMLADIDNKLSQLIKSKSLQDKYDSLTAKADYAVANNDYKTALETYQEAMALNPDQAYYLQKQINFLQRQLAVKDSTLKEELLIEDRRKKFTEGMDAYNKGRSALKDLRYGDALYEFRRFLELIPDTSGLNNNQYNQQGLINFAKLKVKDLEYQQEKDSLSKVEKLAKDSVTQKSSGQIRSRHKKEPVLLNDCGGYPFLIAISAHDIFIARKRFA